MSALPESTASVRRRMSVVSENNAGAAAPPATDADAAPRVLDRAIGDLLGQSRQLGPLQIDDVLRYQREHGVRFGEAAIALGLASDDDVLWALSQQFHYAYAPERGADDLDAELVVAHQPFGDQAEAFRDVRTELTAGALSTAQPRAALAVLSPDRGDGKTFFAANLAIALSQLGVRTLLVDADMRTPRQHALFGLPHAVGLSSLLAGRTDASVVHPIPSLPRLHVMPVGVVPPNPLELVQRPAFGLLVQELLKKFDHVVVDTPAASHGADARAIAAQCGAALVLGRRGVTSMKSLQGLLDAVARHRVRMAGVLVNEHH